jgi:hypothetical protein
MVKAPPFLSRRNAMTEELKYRTFSLGLATLFSIVGALPTFAAPAMPDPLLVTTAVSNDATQVRARGHSRRFGRHVFARGYARPFYPRRNSYDCLGGRDSAGLPC